MITALLYALLGAAIFGAGWSAYDNHKIARLEQRALEKRMECLRPDK